MRQLDGALRLLFPEISMWLRSWEEVGIGDFIGIQTSAWVCNPNLSWAKGDPNPLAPVGGNFAAWTILTASSAVYKRGTMIP